MRKWYHWIKRRARWTVVIKRFLRGCFPNIHSLLWLFLHVPTLYFSCLKGQLYFVPSNSTQTKQILIFFLAHPLTVFHLIRMTSIIPDSQTTNVGVISVPSFLAPVALSTHGSQDFILSCISRFSSHPQPIYSLFPSSLPSTWTCSLLDHTNSHLTLSSLCLFNFPIIFNLSFLKDFSKASMQTT